MEACEAACAGTIDEAAEFAGEEDQHLPEDGVPAAAAAARGGEGTSNLQRQAVEYAGGAKRRRLELEEGLTAARALLEVERDLGAARPSSST